MKKIVSLFIVLVFICTMFAGCNGQKDDDIVLTFWDSYYMGVDDANTPKSEWYITQAIERFEATHPGVKINYVNVEHSSETIKKFELANQSGTGPDIVTLWSSSYAENVKDCLLPLDKYISNEERNIVTGWDTVTFNDITYGYPTNDSGIQVVYYNKAVLNEAGIDFGIDYPKTFDEFFETCETLKDNSITPLLISYKSGGMDAATMSYWFGQMVDAPDTFYKLANGETDFEKETAFIEAARKSREIYTRGYTNVDVLTVDESTLTTRFLNGEGAMIIGNAWYIDVFEGYEDQIGIIPLPSVSSNANIHGTGTGGPGLLLGVSSNSPHQDLSVEFIEFLMSKDEMTQFCQFNKKSIPNRTDITLSEITDDILLLKHAELKKNGYVVWLDNVLPSAVCDTWFQNAPLYFTNQLSDEEYINRLNQTLNEVVQ